MASEDTPTGVEGMHFHGFIGNADLDKYLCPARNNKKFYDGKPNPQYGELVYTDAGDPLFNFEKSFVNIGFTTLAKIKDPDNLKLIYYMTKYMQKDSSKFDYNENSYLHTQNLDFKDKEVAKFSPEQLQSLVNTVFAQEYKNTDRYIIYRIFN